MLTFRQLAAFCDKSSWNTSIGVFRQGMSTVRVNDVDTEVLFVSIPEVLSSQVIQEHLVYYTGDLPPLEEAIDWKDWEEKNLPKFTDGKIVKRTRRTLNASRWFSLMFDADDPNRSSKIEDAVENLRLSFIKSSCIHEEYTGEEVSRLYESEFNGQSSSCMTGDEPGLTHIWGSNPGALRLIVIKNNEKFVARCLVFRPNEETKISNDTSSPIGAGWYYGRIYGHKTDEDAADQAASYLRSIGLLPVPQSPDKKWIWLKMGEDKLCPYVDKGLLCFDGDDVVWYYHTKPAIFSRWQDADVYLTDGSGFGTERSSCCHCEERCQTDDMIYVEHYGDVCDDCINNSDQFVYCQSNDQTYLASDCLAIYAPDYPCDEDLTHRTNRSYRVYSDGRYHQHELVVVNHNDEEVLAFAEYILYDVHGCQMLSSENHTKVDWAVHFVGHQLKLISTQELDGQLASNDIVVDVVVDGEETKAALLFNKLSPSLLNGCKLVFQNNCLTEIDHNDGVLHMGLFENTYVLKDSCGYVRRSVNAEHIGRHFTECSFINLLTMPVWMDGWNVTKMKFSKAESGYAFQLGSKTAADFGYRIMLPDCWDSFAVEKLMLASKGVVDRYGQLQIYTPYDQPRMIDGIMVSPSGNLVAFDKHYRVVMVYRNQSATWHKCNAYVHVSTIEQCNKLNAFIESMDYTQGDIDNVATINQEV